MVSTFAGSGPTDHTGGGYTDGPGNLARFNRPTGLAIDRQGNLYVTESRIHEDLGIRKITPNGVVSTMVFTLPKFYNTNPYGIAVDGDGNLFVTERASFGRNTRVFKITNSGVVSVIAGNNDFGYVDGVGTAALFRILDGIAIDGQGNLYVSDQGNNAVRRISKK
jgi:sugar lactone lactonase YvrE